MSTTTLTHRKPNSLDNAIKKKNKQDETLTPTTTLDQVVEKTVDKMVDTVEKVGDVVEKKILRREVSRFSRLLLTLSLVSSFLYWTALVHPFSGMLYSQHIYFIL